MRTFLLLVILGNGALFWQAARPSRTNRPDKSIDMTNAEGEAVLGIAVGLCGHPDLIRAILDAGADPNHKNPDGVTPLIGAAWSNNAEVVELLLARGADPDLRENHGETALMNASHNNADARIVKALLDRSSAAINLQDFDGDTALMHAAWSGNLAAVKLLLQYGADRSLKNKEGETALQRAQLRTQGMAGHKPEHDEIVKLLRQQSRTP